MTAPVIPEYKIACEKKPVFGFFYTALTFLSLHWAIVMYVNSSYLEQFVTPKTVGLLYTISAAITILIFLIASRVLNRIGNYRLTVLTTAIELVALVGMAFADSRSGAIIFFMIHQTVVPFILFCLDIFMEELIGGNEENTGGTRGLLLTLRNLVTALAALLAGFLLGDAIPNFTEVYLAGALCLLPFLGIMYHSFRRFKDPLYSSVRLLEGFMCFWSRPNIRYVFFAHFILQLFFAWMVIYTPIYLANTLGFNWEEIGQILFVGLLAYVLLEYGVGVLADRWIGEKEMMMLGFVVMGVSTAWFLGLEHAPLLNWMIAMFMTRVGASLVEMTTESYFFKHTQGSDTNLISFFRITRPLSYLVGALLGSVTLAFFSYKFIFLVLALFMVPGVIFSFLLKDTK